MEQELKVYSFCGTDSGSTSCRTILEAFDPRLKSANSVVKGNFFYYSERLKGLLDAFAHAIKRYEREAKEGTFKHKEWWVVYSLREHLYPDFEALVTQFGGKLPSSHRQKPTLSEPSEDTLKVTKEQAERYIGGPLKKLLYDYTKKLNTLRAYQWAVAKKQAEYPPLLDKRLAEYHSLIAECKKDPNALTVERLKELPDLTGHYQKLNASQRNGLKIDGKTLLHIAAEQRNVAVVRQLMALGHLREHHHFLTGCTNTPETTAYIKWFKSGVENEDAAKKIVEVFEPEQWMANFRKDCINSYVRKNYSATFRESCGEGYVKIGENSPEAWLMAQLKILEAQCNHSSMSAEAKETGLALATDLRAKWESYRLGKCDSKEYAKESRELIESKKALFDNYSVLKQVLANITLAILTVATGGIALVAKKVRTGHWFFSNYAKNALQAVDSLVGQVPDTVYRR